MNRTFPILMLVLGFIVGTSVAVAYANGGIDMFADVFIDGTLTVQDGTEGFGKVFTSDGAGAGSWQDLSLPPFDPSGLQTQIDSNDADILQLQTDVSSSDDRLNGIYEKTFTNLLFGFPTPESDPILERVFKCDDNDTVISGGFERNLTSNQGWLAKSWINGLDNQYELGFGVSSTVIKLNVTVKIQCLPE